jgi:hypothetical protein
LLVTLKEDLRDGDRLLAFLALFLELAFLGLVFLGLVFLGLVFLTLVFLTLVRVLVALLAERRRPGFSGFVSGAGAAAGVATGLRPRPKPLAS